MCITLLVWHVVVGINFFCPTCNVNLCLYCKRFFCLTWTLFRLKIHCTDIFTIQKNKNRTITNYINILLIIYCGFLIYSSVATLIAPFLNFFDAHLAQVVHFHFPLGQLFSSKLTDGSIWLYITDWLYRNYVKMIILISYFCFKFVQKYGIKGAQVPSPCLVYIVPLSSIEDTFDPHPPLLIHIR